MLSNPTLPSRALPRVLVGLLVVLLGLGAAPLPASAADPGRVYGTVTDTRGALLGDVRVEAIRYDDSAAKERYLEATAYSDYDGKYSFDDLTPGQYYLRLSDPAGDYVTRFSSGAARPTSTNGAGTFTVVGAQNTLPPAYQLTGAGTSTQVAGYLVKDYSDTSTPELHPIDDEVEIEARWASSGAIAASAISYGGEFELTLDTFGAGAYDVTVKPSRSAGTLGTTFRVNASAGQRLVMAPRRLDSTRPASSVTGTVTSPNGAPVQGAGVLLLALDSTGMAEGFVDSDSTAVNGSFRLGELEKGTSYVIRVTQNSRRTYVGGTTFASARRFTWTASTQAAGATVLPPAASGMQPISGRVTVPGASSLAGVTLRAERWEADDQSWSYSNYVPLSTDGTYSFVPEVPGVFRFVSDYWGSPSGADDPISPYYFGSGVDEPLRPGDAGTINHSGQSATTGVNLALPPASLVRGTVTGSDGEPSSSFSVEAYRWDPATSAFVYLADRYSNGQSGAYALGLAGPGTYTLRFSSYGDDAPQWLGGESDKPDAPRPDNSFSVTTGAGQTVVRNASLLAGVRLAGQVTASGSPTGVPLKNAWVSLYGTPDPDYPEGGLQRVGRTVTDENGRWSISVLPERRLTARVTAPAMQELWTGGGATAPTTFTAENSFAGTRSRTDLDAALQPQASDFGTGAGEKYPFCFSSGFRARSLTSRVVDFPVNVGGKVWDEVVIGSDGALSFGDVADASESLPLGSQDNPPMIAPLLGSARTSVPGSAVTYGISPDGRQLCAVWHQVSNGDTRADSEGTNTFQVLLTRPSASSGRRVGDVDVRFNYDSVSWGRAVSGVGPSSRVVGLQAGWSAADGNTTRQLVFAGSGRPDAFTTTGGSSLVAGTTSADRTGRHNFSIVNSAAAPQRGAVTGLVRGPNGAIRGATVNVCRADGSVCRSSTSGTDGRYTVSDLRPGDYEVVAWPATGDLIQPDVATVAVAAGSSAVRDLDLTAITRLPNGAAVTTGGRTTTQGTPTLFVGSPVRIAIPYPSSGRIPAYAMIQYSDGGSSNEVYLARQGDLLVASGLLPREGGNAKIVLFDANGDLVSGIDVYIDPSGVVTDQYGRALAGATATLLRSDTAVGTYAQVANGSAQMSPGNRTNPDTTTSQGRFGWDVLPGFYKVRAAASGCTTGETPGMSVPPERLDLVLTLQCSAPAPVPTVAPVVSGTAAIGQTLRTTVGSWPNQLGATDRQWLRNGVPIPGADGRSYVVTTADAGTTLSVEESAERAPYTQENGTGTVVTFTPASTRSNGLSVAAVSTPAPGPTPAPGTAPAAPVAPAVATAPVVSGTAKTGQRLVASTGTWNQAGLAFAYQWRRDGVAIPGATGAAYSVVPQDAGSVLTVLVTGSNGAGSAPVTSPGVAVARLATTASGSAKLVTTKVKKGKGKKKTKTVKAYVATVKVSAPGLVASGPATVVVDKTKKLKATVTNGVATVKLPKLKKGKHTLQVVFAGTKQLAPATSKTVTFTTKKI